MDMSHPQYDGESSPHHSHEIDPFEVGHDADAMWEMVSPRGDEPMQINGPAHVHGAQPIRAPHNATNAQQAGQTQSVQGSDEVNISAEAEFLSQVHELPEIRQDRVDSIKAQLADGTYDVDAKLDVALDRVLDELA